jgi:shikimate dehydrogenase
MAARTRLGVLGWPVAHSRSPEIQNAALEAAGLGGWRYQLLPVPPDLFAETVRALPAAGFRGANVTIPHKHAALVLADEATGSARAIGAANTLTFGEDGAIHADNTDAPALIDALPFPPAGRTALVLGAGGSARAAVWALRASGSGEVRVWNRHPDRARALTAELGGVPVQAAERADLLVNCTPVGMNGDPAEFKQLPLEADEIAMYTCVVDFVYSHADTPLVAAAKARGVPVVDGLDLLVGQGALSFERFTGVAAPIDAMCAAARRQPS